MMHDIVPITLGGALIPGHNDYHDTVGAPKHSFIDAYRDYPDPADLARYLKKLKANLRLYAEYFWWKDYYRLKPRTKMTYYCDVCERLHNLKEGDKEVVEDLYQWWDKRSKCRSISVK